MMTEEQHLLTCLGEECNEVAQRCSKAVRFGMHEQQPGQYLDNKQRIEDELGDLLAVAEMLGLRLEANPSKAEKVRRYMVYSRQQGTLE